MQVTFPTKIKFKQKIGKIKRIVVPVYLLSAIHNSRVASALSILF